MVKRDQTASWRGPHSNDETGTIADNNHGWCYRWSYRNQPFLHRTPAHHPFIFILSISSFHANHHSSMTTPPNPSPSIHIKPSNVVANLHHRLPTPVHPAPRAEAPQPLRVPPPHPTRHQRPREYRRRETESALTAPLDPSSAC